MAPMAFLMLKYHKKKYFIYYLRVSSFSTIIKVKNKSANKKKDYNNNRRKIFKREFLTGKYEYV